MLGSVEGNELGDAIGDDDGVCAWQKQTVDALGTVHGTVLILFRGLVEGVVFCRRGRR